MGGSSSRSYNIISPARYHCWYRDCLLLIQVWLFGVQGWEEVFLLFNSRSSAIKSEQYGRCCTPRSAAEYECVHCEMGSKAQSRGPRMMICKSIRIFKNEFRWYPSKELQVVTKAVRLETEMEGNLSRVNGEKVEIRSRWNIRIIVYAHESILILSLSVN